MGDNPKQEDRDEETKRHDGFPRLEAGLARSRLMAILGWVAENWLKTEVLELSVPCTLVSRGFLTMRILIIEDERNMAQLLKRAVDEKGHSSTVSLTGQDGLAQALSGVFDVIVLDLMLPDIDGFAVAQALRAERNRVPILILTALDTVADMVRALDLGADDYLTKPFALAEFMARLRAIGRRGPVLQPAVLRVADITLNPVTCEVRRGDKLISLTKTEYLLLEFFMRRPSRVLSKAAIIDGVWSADKNVEENTLEAFIKLLRAKIDDEREEKLIQTIRGFGYRLHSRSES
jgi:DNA-binding response OmpR family regulator